MKLHIFNPEHDIALAVNRKRFTPPHAGRQLRADIGFVPAFWAADGDLVLVDNVENALESVRHLKKYAHDVVFITADDLKSLGNVEGLSIVPWGWDITIREQLLSGNNSFERLMPNDEQLRNIREISNRRFAAKYLLPQLRQGRQAQTVGESYYCEDEITAWTKIEQCGKCVLKSPWSSSGRGVRYITSSTVDNQTKGWVKNVIHQQGGIMVEPLYAKVLDFGMEYTVDKNGEVEYCGLSLFSTSGSAYTGNLLATEADKREILSRYFDIDLLESVSADVKGILKDHLRGVYKGAFGIDMMAVAKTGKEGFYLHPCVELNLRMTMGHLALALAPYVFEPQRVMNISFTDKYRIRIHETSNNVINNGII